MSISNVTASSNSLQTDWRAKAQQSTDDFNQLLQTMQAGNLSTAQQAFSTLSGTDTAAATSSDSIASISALNSAASLIGADSSKLSQAQAVYSAMQVGTIGNSVSADLNSLSQVLQTGDTSSAQNVLAKLEQDLKQGHHHHHHGGGAHTQNTASTYSDISALTASNDASSSSTAVV